MLWVIIILSATLIVWWLFLWCNRKAIRAHEKQLKDSGVDVDAWWSYP